MNKRAYRYANKNERKHFAESLTSLPKSIGYTLLFLQALHLCSIKWFTPHKVSDLIRHLQFLNDRTSHNRNDKTNDRIDKSNVRSKDTHDEND